MAITPISCTQYDHFEIACMHNSMVFGEFKKGLKKDSTDKKCFEGRALTLKIMAGVECLILETKTQHRVEIALHEIANFNYDGKTINL